MRHTTIVSSLAVLACCGGPRSGPHAGPPAAPSGAVQSRYSQLTLTLVHRMADGSEVEVATLDRPIADLAMTPIVLDVVTGPLVGSKGGGGPSIGLGTLGGGGDAAPAGAAQLDASWRVGDAAPTVLPAAASLCDAAKTCLAEQRLRIELTGADAPPRTVERTLLELPGKTPAPLGHRRYVLDVFAGVVTDAEADAARAALDAWGAEHQAAFEVERAAHGDDAARIETLRGLDVAGAAGHAIATRFAAVSDRMTEHAAAVAGVAITRPTPRVLVTSFEADAKGKTRVSLDLRLDEVEVDGDATTAAHLQLARGTGEARLEGEVLAQLIQQPAVTTARVMEAASAAGVDLRGLMGEDAALPRGLPALAAARVRAALAAGHQVILPASAVVVDGAPRWGWWDIDPTTMRTIGVMEDGQHQAMTEFNESLEKLGLNGDTAFVVGMLIGTDYTAYAIMGEILGHGVIDDAFLEGLAEQMESVACTMCPTLGAELKVEQKAAGDCLKANIKPWTHYDESFEFCERYNDGFKCAAGIIIGALRRSIRPYEVSASAKIKLGCDYGGDIGTGDTAD